MLKLHIIFVSFLFTSLLPAADFGHAGQKRGSYRGTNPYAMRPHKKTKKNLEPIVLAARQKQQMIYSKFKNLELTLNLAITDQHEEVIIAQYENVLNKTSNPEEQCFALKLIAEIYMASLHYDKAIEKFSEMLAISKQERLGNFFTVEALLGLMEANLNNSKYEILDLMEQTETLLEGDRHFIRYYTVCANYYAANNQHERADSYFDLIKKYLYRGDISELDYYTSKGIYLASILNASTTSINNAKDEIENTAFNIKFSYIKIPQLLRLIKFYELIGNQEKSTLFKNRLRDLWNKTIFFHKRDIPMPDEYKTHKSSREPNAKANNRKIKKDKNRASLGELIQYQNTINRKLKKARKEVNTKLEGLSTHIDDRISHLNQLFIKASIAEKCYILKMLAEIYFAKMDYTEAAQKYLSLYNLSKQNSVENFWILEGLLGYLQVRLEISHEEIDWKKFFEEAESLLTGNLEYLRFYTLRGRYNAKSESNLAYNDFKHGEQFGGQKDTEFFDYHIARSLFLTSTNCDSEALSQSLNIIDNLANEKVVGYFNIPTIIQYIKVLELGSRYKEALHYTNQVRIILKKALYDTQNALEYIDNQLNKLLKSRLDNEINALRAEEYAERAKELSKINTLGDVPDWGITDEASLQILYPYTSRYSDSGGYNKKLD